MGFVKMCGRAVYTAFYRFTSIILGGALILYVWWYTDGEDLLWLQNFNLKLIQAIAGLLQKPMSTKVESALRLTFTADKAMLFFEAALAVKIALSPLLLVWWLLKKGYRKVANRQTGKATKGGR